MHLPELYDDEAARKRHGRSLAVGEVGCSLSHQLMYRTLLASSNNYALVLEDDAVIDSKGLTELERHIEYLDFDVITLYTESGTVKAKPKFRLGTTNLHEAVEAPTQTVAYFVSRAGAKKLLRDPPVSWLPDWPGDFHKIKMYLTIPFLARQEGLDSYVSEERTLLQGLASPQNNLTVMSKIQRKVIRIFSKYHNLRDLFENEVMRKFRSTFAFLYIRCGGDADHINKLLSKNLSPIRQI